MQERNDQIRCLVCKEGCQQGIAVLDEFICKDCEQEIVKTDVKDQKYPYFVTRLKNLWTHGQGRYERGL
ncbi:MAG: sigma factor G inhibitor Gin [Firmicutes bacterium]|uniref:Inhibitor of sigma-G Gin n=1 Tax=Melghirimyces thermohalophilus TaxID=1236220 RepID=A0A1G6PZ81_9BACL|nr:sigma factor G inhibitor Gin [Melghirimyces thermohalophilus]MDA8354180.1 sigma factor G inhibitor Gin [Bacillota bacterium]SDC85423.1 Inhibitor of sigma-G Gin [Melghirimyces thermohalophilus]